MGYFLLPCLFLVTVIASIEFLSALFGLETAGRCQQVLRGFLWGKSTAVFCSKCCPESPPQSFHREPALHVRHVPKGTWRPGIGHRERPGLGCCGLLCPTSAGYPLTPSTRPPLNTRSLTYLALSQRSFLRVVTVWTWGDKIRGPEFSLPLPYVVFIKVKVTWTLWSRRRREW